MKGSSPSWRWRKRQHTNTKLRSHNQDSLTYALKIEKTRLLKVTHFRDIFTPNLVHNAIQLLGNIHADLVQTYSNDFLSVLSKVYSYFSDFYSKGIKEIFSYIFTRKFPSKWVTLIKRAKIKKWL